MFHLVAARGDDGTDAAEHVDTAQPQPVPVHRGRTLIDELIAELARHAGRREAG